MEAFVFALILLTIAALVYYFSHRRGLPYTIILFVCGVLFNVIAPQIGISTTETLGLTPDLLFYVFLPVLLFESAYHIRYQDISRDYPSIWSLAIVGVLISA